VLQCGAAFPGARTTASAQTTVRRGGAPVSSGGRKKKASKGCFAKRKKYSGLSVNTKFPTILGLK